MKAKERIICALDVPGTGEAWQLVEELDGVVDFFKVGMLLYLGGGREFVASLLSRGKKVFLDLKLYDVPDTVGPTVRQVAAMGVDFLTVHGHDAILQRAAEEAAGSNLKILGVTVLTSFDQADLEAMGFPCSVEELVLHRAANARRRGCSGVVASAREAALIRQKLGPELIVVTPGIRPAGASLGTHKRPTTPGEALRAGANYLVVGQPIIKAPDPRRAAQAIIEELEREEERG
ncbi:MAG TPA: orotidine-5'-phosphate decarboxylase [Bacillota bacterium]|jgi:orotidine-5'-phosphate decarboxylase|nr:orotidine-5'-phosphate decarboxylase [Bacillota bacterium]